MSTKIPQYQVVAAALRDEISCRPANSLLPTEHQLARRFGTSRVTVRGALDLLERSGLVSRHRGRGTIISPPKITRRFSPLYSFEQDLADQGISFETRVLSYEPEWSPPGFIGDCLRLPPKTLAGFLSLVRLVDDRIVCHDGRYYPPTIAPFIQPHLMEDRDASKVLEDVVGTHIRAVDWESEITASPTDVAAALGILPGTLVLANTFTYRVENGIPIEAGVISYRVDCCKFRYEMPFDRPIMSE